MDVVIMIYLQLFTLFSAGIIKDTMTLKKSNITEIFVIGTVHESTPNFSADTLLNVFNKIKPDLILVETDTSYFNNDFSLNEDIEYMSPETTAITEYLKKQTVKLRPYDINGRDLFLDDNSRLGNQYNFFNDIESISESGKYNEYASDIYLKIRNMMELADEMSNETLTYINSDTGSQNIDTINYYTYEGLEKLIDNTPELSKYGSYWNNEYEYWKKRNNVMLNNILSISKEFKGKKILVMCGFAHKNFLIKELTGRSEEYNILVKDLNDI